MSQTSVEMMKVEVPFDVNTINNTGIGRLNIKSGTVTINGNVYKVVNNMVVERGVNNKNAN
ncbi:hypothetical protein [Megavirus chiliensis]|uniref:Uncharacterized protein n=3 Tax=Megamimivirinae TaxID=3044648 RepID=A0A2L2DND0_MIMIV|nr:hypothetical protein MegaChil _gp0834 [Megavirus chiliensis]AEQ33306.1 hypothetical protein [Megavirus chiliensis]AGD92788.1 hypothetical protein LBA_00870 [Megavirus lba]AVG47670.1 hypothetical protein [Acanthamoeba polyphaga mimivirus]